MGQKSFMEEFAKREQVPAEILKVANLVKSIDMEEFKEFKEDNHHFGKFPDTLILIYTMDKIANLKTALSKKFVERAYAFDVEYQKQIYSVYKIDEWFINPAKIMGFDSELPEVFKENDFLSIVPNSGYSLANFLLGHYGLFAEYILGIDFTKKKWVERFSEELTPQITVLQFLKASFSMAEFEDFKNTLESFTFKPKFNNNYGFSAHFMLFLLSNVIDAIGEYIELDAIEDVRVCAHKVSENNWKFWIELYDFILILNELTGLVEIEEANDFPFKKQEEYTMLEFIKESSGVETEDIPRNKMN